MSTSSKAPAAEIQRPQRLGVVLVAAGSGQRLGHGIPKAQVPLSGEPMLAHALRRVIASGVADHICVTVPRGDDQLRRLCTEIAQSTTTGAAADARARTAQLTVVDGGSTRADSVRAALQSLSDDVDTVLVHDAARALTPPEVFQRVAQALAAGAEAVIPVRVLVDTVKLVRHADADRSHISQELVAETVDRTKLRTVQTPQGFRRETLVRAHAAAEMYDDEQSAAVTDDAMLVEALGTDVFAVPGSDLSLKITTPTDLVLAEALLQAFGS